MGMEQTKAFKPAGAGPKLVEWRNKDGLIVAQYDGLNPALTIDQKTYLTIEINGELG